MPLAMHFKYGSCLALLFFLAVPSLYGQIGTQLVPAETNLSDYYGTSLAIDGDYAFVGAPEEQAFGVPSGAVFVFFDDPSQGWIEVNKLVPSDGAVGDLFGTSVAILDDYAIVGAVQHDAGSGRAGAAYVFFNDPTSGWSEVTKLTAPDGYPGDLFGQAVALSENHAVVSASADDGKGSAYVFVRNGSNWESQTKLISSQTTPGGLFGTSVSMDGDYIAIGAPKTNDEKGAVTVFVRSGSTWTAQAHLQADDTSFGDRFGTSVSIDGNALLVGAPRNDNRGENAGSAYIFERSGGSWTQQAQLVASDAEPGAQFGLSVALAEDYALVGTSDGVTVYVFHKKGSYWPERVRLELPGDPTRTNPDGGPVASGKGRKGGIGGRGRVQVFSMTDIPELALSTPLDAQTGLGVTTNLTWASFPNLVSYRLQVSMVPDFSVLSIDEQSLNETSHMVGGLAHGTQYFWRVQANGSEGIAPWSEIRTFITEAGGSTQVSLASPADGIDNIAFNPMLAWNAVGGASSYRLQVSTHPEFLFGVVNTTGITTTSYQLQNLSPTTTYYWRVLASNAGPSNWSHPRRFTTMSGLPAQVVLNDPEGPDQDTDPLLQWDVSGLATSYTVQLSTDPEFNVLVVHATDVSQSSYQVRGLGFGTIYYWRVRAVNDFGISPWSEVQRFITKRGGAFQVQLSAPANGATGLTLSPWLIWDPVDGAVSYHVQVSTQINFVSVVIDEAGLTDIRYQAQGLSPNTTYYWRVLGSNSGTNNWSRSGQFSTGSGTPSQVSLSSPAPQATGLDVNLTVTWKAALQATSYRLQLAKSTDYTSIVTNLTGLTDTTYILRDLDYGTQYYWRIQASNALGLGPWSESGLFITKRGGPEQVILDNPADGVSAVSVYSMLMWHPVEGAASYHLQVSTLNDFATAIIDAPTVTDTTYQTAALEPHTMYYWRVRASNAGEKNWSSIRNFTTGSLPPAMPTLLIPADSTQGVDAAPVLTWLPSPTATSYQLQLAVDSLFNQIAFEAGTSDTTYHITEPLNYLTQYFWRVGARNSSGQVWSPVWRFTTVLNVAVETPELPNVYALEQNYPNPFNPSTRITFALPQPEAVRLTVYDVQGHEVARLIDQTLAAGRHEYVWNAAALPSGLYIYRIQAGSFTAMRKMVLLK